MILKAVIKLTSLLLKTENQDSNKSCKMQNFGKCNFSEDSPGGSHY